MKNKQHVKDYLGTNIVPGNKAILVKASSGEYSKVTVIDVGLKDFNFLYKNQPMVKIKSENSHLGRWTYPDRLIMESNFKKEFKNGNG